MMILDIVVIMEIGRKFLARLVGPFLWMVEMTDSRQVEGIDEGRFHPMIQTMMTSLSRRDTKEGHDEANLTCSLATPSVPRAFPFLRPDIASRISCSVGSDSSILGASGCASTASQAPRVNA